MQITQLSLSTARVPLWFQGYGPNVLQVESRIPKQSVRWTCRVQCSGGSVRIRPLAHEFELVGVVGIRVVPVTRRVVIIPS